MTDNQTTITTDKPKNFKHLKTLQPIVLGWYQAISKNPDNLLSLETSAQSSDNNPQTIWYQQFTYKISQSDIAKLRRCQSLADVAMQPAFIALWQAVSDQLEKSPSDKSTSKADFDAWLTVAWVLSQVKRHDTNDTYQNPNQKDKSPVLANRIATLASISINDKPIISPLRFEKLVSAGRVEEFATLLVRMVKQLEQQHLAINVLWLANDILHWLFDRRHNTLTPKDRLAVQWSLLYYRNNSSAKSN